MNVVLSFSICSNFYVPIQNYYSTIVFKAFLLRQKNRVAKTSKYTSDRKIKTIKTSVSSEFRKVGVFSWERSAGAGPKSSPCPCSSHLVNVLKSNMNLVLAHLFYYY